MESASNCRILCSICKRIMYLQFIHYLRPMGIFWKGPSTSPFSLFVLFLISPLVSFSKGLNITTYSSWSIPLKLRKNTFSLWKCEYYWRKGCDIQASSMVNISLGSTVDLYLAVWIGLCISGVSEHETLCSGTITVATTPEMAAEKQPLPGKVFYLMEYLSALPAERCLTGSWTKAITPRGTPVMSWGRCWKLWPTFTLWK